MVGGKRAVKKNNKTHPGSHHCELPSELSLKYSEMMLKVTKCPQYFDCLSFTSSFNINPQFSCNLASLLKKKKNMFFAL